MAIHFHRRRGAIAVEAAVVNAAMFMVLLAFVAGGLGVFRYQEMVNLARETARAASVKGTNYEAATGQTSPTQAQFIQTVVAPLAVTMDQTKLTVTIQWINGITGAATPWDSASKSVKSYTPLTGQPVTNLVRVTVTYQWTPEFLVTGPFNLQSVAEHPMSF
jgi:Flp pilus assembly protein TadG